MTSHHSSIGIDVIDVRVRTCRQILSNLLYARTRPAKNFCKRSFGTVLRCLIKNSRTIRTHGKDIPNSRHSQTAIVQLFNRDLRMCAPSCEQQDEHHQRKQMSRECIETASYCFHKFSNTGILPAKRIILPRGVRLQRIMKLHRLSLLHKYLNSTAHIARITWCEIVQNGTITEHRQ